MAGRRPAAAPPAPDQLQVPLFLLAGPCTEVWFPERTIIDEWEDYSVTTWTRARNCRRVWLELHDLDRNDESVPLPLRQGGSPWSHRAWSLRGMVTDMLARCGLPPDWVPTAAPRVLRELPRYGAPSPDAARLLTGE